MMCVTDYRKANDTSLLFHPSFILLLPAQLLLTLFYSTFISMHRVIFMYSRASLLRAPLLCGFGSNAVGRGPQFSAIRGKCQMDLLKPTSTQETLSEVNNVNERVLTSCLFWAAAGINHCLWLHFSGF